MNLLWVNMDEKEIEEAYVNYYCNIFRIPEHEARKLVALRMPAGEIKEWFAYGFSVDEIVALSSKGIKPRHARFIEKLTGGR